MIKRLIINNLVLVDQGDIEFTPAFNAMTGETGAGKTAFMEAIGLCLGERSDQSLIRKGAQKAFVELHISLEGLSGVKQLLEEAGLEGEEEMVIRRELSSEGKSRALVNCRAVPLPLLQQIGKELIDRIGASSHYALRSFEAQRTTLDLFAGIELRTFQACLQQEIELQGRLEVVKQQRAHKERDEPTLRFQLEELQGAALKENEEEELFMQHSQLIEAQERGERAQAMLDLLSEGASSILSNLSKLLKLHPSESVTALLEDARLSLKEAEAQIQSSSEEAISPKSLLALEERLSLIAKLKRKYGPALENAAQLIKQLEEKLEPFSEDVEALEEKLASAQRATQDASKILSTKRKEAATTFQEALSLQLNALNMNGASVHIHVTPQERSSSGEDGVQFWIQANAGENLSLVKEHASGGELARLLFAIKVTLAEKNKTPTLIFDEIDANIGGKTAALMGETLSELGKHKQVICITHFPQVAAHAQTHFQVEKVVKEGRTLTVIRCLEGQEKERELLRMRGE